jgi:hypothetical protein
MGVETSGTERVIAVVRRSLLAILVLGLVGTEIELFLLKHTDGFWQIAPLGLIAAGIVVVGWCAFTQSAASLRALDVVMIAFILSGAAGVLLHFRGNVDWERERTPGIGGSSLVRQALMGATPTLAPGTMLQLGLVGLIYSYVRRRERPKAEQ